MLHTSFHDADGHLSDSTFRALEEKNTYIFRRVSGFKNHPTELWVPPAPVEGRVERVSGDTPR